MQLRKIIIAVGVSTLAVAGCGAEVTGQPAGAPTKTTPAEATFDPSGPPSPTTATGDGTLTPTRTTLTVGQPATVEYETKTSSKESTKLIVTVTSVKKGDLADLKNFNLDAQTKASEPYYIAVTMRNAGPKPMEPGGIFGLLNAHNADGDKLAGLYLLGEFGKCESDVPDTVAVDAEFANCEVYLSPPGQGVDKAVFGYYGVDNKRTEITWKAG